MKKKESIPSQKGLFNNFYYEDIAKLTAAGGWSINFQDKTSYLDPEARRILKTPDAFRPSLRTALDFYSQEHKRKISELFETCSVGESFDTTIKMLTYSHQEFWAKVVGRPVYNTKKQVIGIQGVFQDIHTEKLKELSLETSLRVIESQNARLFNFAHIVSHNLRSHASNLHLTLELLRSIESPEEEAELKASLFDVSDSLNETINHLNEIVTAQTKSTSEMRLVRFDKTLEIVSSAISRIIEDENTEIYADFSEVAEIEYIPSYLESIFLNLMTNAIKYRHPDRSPIIDICTFEFEGDTFLQIKDNGLGIDLDRHGEALFNMYQTFHASKDSVGIGLFITKNQVETLQGSIHVTSVEGEGSVFKIKF